MAKRKLSKFTSKARLVVAVLLFLVISSWSAFVPPRTAYAWTTIYLSQGSTYGGLCGADTSPEVTRYDAKWAFFGCRSYATGRITAGVYVKAVAPSSILNYRFVVGANGTRGYSFQAV